MRLASAAHETSFIDLLVGGRQSTRPALDCQDTHMKDQQDHSVVTNWGGRAERYREFKRTAIRAHDTFGVWPVQFSHAYHYEAWVLERFAANTQSITCQPTSVTAMIDAVELSSKATFVVTRRGGRTAYVLLTKCEPPPATFRVLKKIAHANGAEVVHRTRSEVRARVEEFWFFEKLRQNATIWVRRGAEFDGPLLEAVGTGRKALSELCQVVDAPKDLIRARLARLHVDGRLIIERDDSELAATAVPGGMQ
jgi:hypothetical protein